MAQQARLIFAGEAAATVLKVIGIAQDAGAFIEAVKSGKPDKIIIESLRLAVSLFTLKSQCFTGDTLVSTAEGNRRIDEVEAGDYVWSYDTENDKKVLARVTDVSVTETDVLVHVFTSDGDDIQTTMFHPFYVKDTDNTENCVWIAASNLVKGQEFYTKDGKIEYVEEVRIENLDGSIRVYNLEIEGLHTYFVADGVLVHNVCDITNEQIYETMEDAPLQTQQSSVSKPVIQIYYDRIMNGETDVPPIKVDGNIIVNGNHRYIACRLAGIEIGIIPWNGGNIDKVISWLDIKIDEDDWGNR